MLCAALATAQAPFNDAFKVCVIEDRLPEPFEAGTSPSYDLRVSALSIASEQMLKHVGAWQGIADRRKCEYKRLTVWDGEQDGRTEFNAGDIRASHLGHIVENRVIQLALLDRIKQLPNVHLFSPARLARYRQSKNGVTISLEDGRKIQASLLVGADGANSNVRRESGIAMEKKVYPQHALVATVTTRASQQDITWQRFVPTGPQAFLPLCGSQGSIVWYHTQEELQRLKQLPDSEFIDELNNTFPEQLGGVSAVQSRGSFPLAKAHAKSYIANRVALVGDAAHTVHPLAGQGVNIGLLDAAALAQVLREANTKGRDIGEHAVLRRYERWRYGDNQIMIGALDALYEAFKPRPALVQQARSASLNLVDRVGPLKNQLMRHAMGVSGDLPTIASVTSPN
ncbi:UNVERIFIED_CONTAM: hypothetical protein GTU68_062723 [Idotea baltica]|nr:hypothetical protein [Idotea baltica]